MGWRWLIAVLLAGAPAVAPGQEIKLYSEFRRIGANGEVIEADRGGTPREILSPAIPRNGYATFRLVIQGPAGQAFHLYVGENPENIVKSTVYRELTEEGIPDKLEKVETPVSGVFSDAAHSFVIDVWTPPTAAVRRVRLEAQLHVAGNWIIYPLELRLQPASIPHLPLTTGQVAAVTAPSADTAVSAWDPYLCAQTHRAADAGLTVRGLIRRNASQDVALARKLEAKHGKDRVWQGIAQALGAPDVAAWCGARKLPQPEMYLKLRDFLYKLATEGQ